MPSFWWIQKWIATFILAWLAWFFIFGWAFLHRVQSWPRVEWRVVAISDVWYASWTTWPIFQFYLSGTNISDQRNFWPPPWLIEWPSRTTPPNWDGKELYTAMLYYNPENPQEYYFVEKIDDPQKNNLALFGSTLFLLIFLIWCPIQIFEYRKFARRINIFANVTRILKEDWDSEDWDLWPIWRIEAKTKIDGVEKIILSQELYDPDLSSYIRIGQEISLNIDPLFPEEGYIDISTKH